MRKYVIGDIHGGYRALLQCLKKVNFDFEKDQLIVLGDICDGWSEFLECIDLLSKIKNLIKILGNHDDWALDYAKGKMKPHWNNDDFQIWYNHGGAITKEKLDTVPGAKEKLINFFEESKLYHIQDNMCFVHAGIGAISAPDKLPRYHYLFDRTLFETMYDRYKNINIHVDYPFKSIYDKIFIGHTPTYRYEGLNYDPFIYSFLRAIDTGAVFTGPLTIMDIETDEYWQSDIVQTLYPNEHGRNKK